MLNESLAELYIQKVQEWLFEYIILHLYTRSISQCTKQKTKQNKTKQNKKLLNMLNDHFYP